MIPYSILSGRLIARKGQLPAIRILDTDLEGFTFRLARRYDALLQGEDIFCGSSPAETGPEITSVTLNFYRFSDDTFRTVTLTDLTLSVIEKKEFFTVYRIQISENDPRLRAYSDCTACLSREYGNYITLKQSGDDALLSRELTGYPARLDDDFPASLADWRKYCFHTAARDAVTLPDDIPLFLRLDTPELLCGFLNGKAGTDSPAEIPDVYSLDAPAHFTSNDSPDAPAKRRSYLEHIRREYFPDRIQFSPEQVRGICIGNSFCFHLLPDPDLLRWAIETITGRGLKLMLELPPMPQSSVGRFQSLLAVLKEYPSLSCEIVLNDWGTAEMIATDPVLLTSEHICLTLGILLNKRRKDVRLSYKNGQAAQLSLLKENTSNLDIYRSYLEQEYRITGYACESCGYSYTPAEARQILYLPYYQMNTAGTCTLYAMHRFGSRGKQVHTSDCPRVCLRDCFLYPKHLTMTGRYNSLTGFDQRLFSDEAYRRELFDSRPQSIILTLL